MYIHQAELTFYINVKKTFSLHNNFLKRQTIVHVIIHETSFAIYLTMRNLFGMFLGMIIVILFVSVMQ